MSRNSSPSSIEWSVRASASIGKNPISLRIGIFVDAIATQMLIIKGINTRRDFEYAGKPGHHLRMRNADASESAGAPLLDETETSYTLKKKHGADQ
jgi:hypothetical protein